MNDKPKKLLIIFEVAQLLPFFGVFDTIHLKQRRQKPGGLCGGVHQHLPSCLLPQPDTHEWVQEWTGQRGSDGNAKEGLLFVPG